MSRYPQMNPKDKEWIDNATYAELLTKWRFGNHKTDRMLHGQTLIYFSKVKNEKFVAMHPSDAHRISAEVGWGKS